MRSKCLTVVLVLSLAVNAGVIATLGCHYFLTSPAAPVELCPISPGDSYLYRSLGLSKLQLSKMDPLARSFHSRLAELGTAMEGKRELLIDLLQKGNDPVAVEKLRKEIAGIQDDIQNEVIMHIAEVKKILDLKQQQRLFDLMRQNMVRNTLALPSGGK